MTQYLEDIYMNNMFLENYLFPQQIAPMEETPTEEDQIEEKIHRVKANMVNVFRGLDTIATDPKYTQIVNVLKQQLRPVLRKMQVRLTIDKPTTNLTPLQLKQKIATIQGLLSSTTLLVGQLKDVYQKHGMEKMVDTLDVIEQTISAPAHSFSRYIFEPLHPTPPNR